MAHITKMDKQSNYDQLTFKKSISISKSINFLTLQLNLTQSYKNSRLKLINLSDFHTEKIKPLKQTNTKNYSH